MNRLLYDECAKKLTDLDQKKIMDLIEQGAEPIYFDITGKIALHTIAEAGLINKLPEDKFNAWKELFNWPDNCCISPIGYTLLKSNIEDGVKFWKNEEHANLLIQFILCGNGDKDGKMDILEQIFQYKNDRLRSTHMDKAVRTVDIIRTKKSETVKGALKRKEAYGSLEENLNVIKQFYKERKLTSTDSSNGFTDNGHAGEQMDIGDVEDDVFAGEEPIGKYDLSPEAGKKYLLIINVDKYQSGNDRDGCKADEQLLKSKFNKLGFESHLARFGNLELNDYVERSRAVNFFKKVRKEFEEIDIAAVAIVIMAHGGEFDQIKFSDDKKLPLRDLILPILECGKLNGKPKIIVTQFCRGIRHVEGQVEEFVETDNDDNRTPVNQQLDMVICYATAPGNYAVRARNGSHFIRYFADLLRKGASIEDIMKRVTMKICNKSFSIAHEQDIVTVKIAPQIESTLRKNLVF